MAQTHYALNRILEVLAEQEAAGYAFYEEAAAAIEDAKARRLFLKLAGDERKHEGFYRDLMKKYDGKTHAIDDEDAQFIDLLLSQPLPLDAAGQKMREGRVWNKDQALAVAERLERDTILFLAQLLSLDSPFAGEKAFSAALKEEKRHLFDILQSRKDAVSASMML